MCLLVPESIIEEVKYVTSGNDIFRDVKVIPVPYGNILEQTCDCINCESIQQTLDKSDCFTKALLLHGSECPEIIKPPQCEGALHTHSLGNICQLFLTERDMEKLDGEFLVFPGWLNNLIASMEEDELEKVRIIKHIETSYNSILYLDTGFYEKNLENINKLSDYTGKLFRVVKIDPEIIRLKLENIVLNHDCTSKSQTLKEANKRVASCSMSIDIIKELVDLEDEKEVAEKIIEIFNILFAPKNVSYVAIKDKKIQSEYCINFSGDTEYYLGFLDMNKRYLLNDELNGFRILIKSNDQIMGIIEANGFYNSENINEYLNTALLITKASSLVVSNIRRFNDLQESKKRQQDLTETLKVMNKILRHDIANNLNIEINGIELYQLDNKKDYLEMAQKAAFKSVETINNMKAMEYQLFEDGKDLIPYRIRDAIESNCMHFNISCNIEGDAIVMADNAFPSIIENMIRNAQVHGKADKINVSIKDNGSICSIRIQDNGIGIPEEITEHIFEDGFKYGSTGNTGIGLFIVKKTIERYNGTISAKSSEQSGAVFVIDLPSIQSLNNI